jgi:PAS domain S-box-containing protein
MRNLTRLPWFSPLSGVSYLIAIVGVAAAVIANLLLGTYLQASPTLFLFLCAIIFAAWFGGVGPGLAAIALSIGAFDYFFLSPLFSFGVTLRDMPRLALFATAGLFVVGLIVVQRSTAESLRRSRADLENKLLDLEKLNSALKISEAYLAEAQRLSHAGSFGWNVSSGEIVWSEESYRIFEYESARRATIDMVLNRVHPDDMELVREVIERATNDKEAFDFEHRLLMPDGSTKHLNVVARPAADESGEWQFVGVVMDITARRKSEEALRNSEQRYRHLFQYMPIALWQLNASEVVELFGDLRAVGVTELGSYIDQHPELLAQAMDSVKIEEVNERMMEMLGTRNAREILGPLTRFCHIHMDAFRRGLESRFRGETAHQLETKILTVDGRTVDVLLAATRPELVKDPDITLVGVIDITDRLRAQEELRRSEQRFRHLFQHMPIGLLQLNASKLVELLNALRAQGVTELGPYLDQHPHFFEQLTDAERIEEANERAIEMLSGRPASQMSDGRPASEILGSLARRYHSPDAFRHALESRWRGEPTHQEEIKMATLDGRVIDVFKTATRPGLISDPHMSLIGIVDITQRVRAQEMLQRVQAEFAHAARVSTLGELTASIAHEVNQPLAAIATNGEVGLRLLSRSEPDLAELRELSKAVVDDARRAADIIARVRTMATRQAPEQTLLSVDEIVGDALVFLRHEVQSHNVTVMHYRNPAAPKALADRTQLQQVVVNLTVNAIQAMLQAKAARRTLVIRTTFSDPRTLCCTIEDSGPGIKPEHLDQLFNSFFTTKDSGMGLGLPISRSIIEAHGGCIRADNGSAYGGARFSFTLPATLH